MSTNRENYLNKKTSGTCVTYQKFHFKQQLTEFKASFQNLKQQRLSAEPKNKTILVRNFFVKVLYRWINVSLSHKYLTLVSVYCMLYWDKICKKCNICQLHLFKDRDFLYQPHLCNGCHNAPLQAILLRNFKIISVKGNTYRFNSNLLYNKSHLFLESSSLNNKFASLQIT